ncbi:hypothetical protein CONPUDRAFT_149562 [Coniophora puteana RWD-64-598 SS2]|uniref:Uncharacterized protein n=1 Tax=Coniophora puteana (strain RWD-64-598) TaxID=741705 RepID=A0A5M3MZY0_CONPW|nr:uncharacterized protein CONPUDRAFT_149562 [Coniophora puteana RWD-64-598 SS2]EIW84692.1 hypothetical protein CONPUDRAFT_149562 [Coniophora puteana RWD-64-598 SS2]
MSASQTLFLPEGNHILAVDKMLLRSISVHIRCRGSQQRRPSQTYLEDRAPEHYASGEGAQGPSTTSTSSGRRFAPTAGIFGLLANLLNNPTDITQDLTTHADI